MKKIILGITCFVVSFFGCTIIAHTFQVNTFPDRYSEILERYFGDYDDYYKAGHSIDSGEGKIPAETQIQYGNNHSQQVIIHNEESLFTQLEEMYTSIQYDELKKRIGDQNIDLYVRNAYNAIRPQVLPFDYTKDNDRIAKDYTKYYSPSFCIHNGYTLDKLFEKQSGLYMIFVCDNEDIAKALINEVKNANAIIIITKESVNIEYDKVPDHHYLFYYNGELIENGYELMGQNRDYQDDDNMCEQGTVIYNYNQYIKSQLNNNSF
ncbi:hypothetical protein [Candidatus Stoquefichus massiliensis]|uniref:hypothetical protein n=1 Tax=Candidatus Stoquefichus massiliensis TaxID=1470350 RepID=UPI000480F931|nr:hypothetical protein [Candidatus Stoquefichus massiliensis]